jgi:hypothetical protein
MTQNQAAANRLAEKKGTGWRRVYFVFACLMLACIVAQTLLAGLAIFEEPVYWVWHSMFVKMFTYVPLLMLLFTFPGKMDSRMRMGTIGLFILIYAQYFTANLPSAGLLHPVIALFMFGLSVVLVKQSYRIIAGRQEES